MSRSKPILFFLVFFLLSSSLVSASISVSNNNTTTSTNTLVLIGDSITKSDIGSLYINNLSSMPYWNNLSIINSGMPACSVKLYYEHQYRLQHGLQ